MEPPKPLKTQVNSESSKPVLTLTTEALKYHDLLLQAKQASSSTVSTSNSSTPPPTTNTRRFNSMEIFCTGVFAFIIGLIFGLTRLGSLELETELTLASFMVTMSVFVVTQYTLRARVNEDSCLLLHTAKLQIAYYGLLTFSLVQLGFITFRIYLDDSSGTNASDAITLQIAVCYFTLMIILCISEQNRFHLRSSLRQESNSNCGGDNFHVAMSARNINIVNHHEEDGTASDRSALSKLSSNADIEANRLTA